MAFSYYRNKEKRRRTKTAGQRQARMKVHQQRLVALGMAEQKVMAMTCKELRDALKRPAKIVAAQA